MGRVIYKYPILQPNDDPVAKARGDDRPVLKDEFSMKLPVDAEPIHVCAIREVPWLWVLHDAGADVEKETRHFCLYGTGHPIPNHDERRLTHIGTFIMANGTFVGHLFEEGRE